MSVVFYNCYLVFYCWIFPSMTVWQYTLSCVFSVACHSQPRRFVCHPVQKFLMMSSHRDSHATHMKLTWVFNEFSCKLIWVSYDVFALMQLIWEIVGKKCMRFSWKTWGLHEKIFFILIFSYMRKIAKTHVLTVKKEFRIKKNKKFARNQDRTSNLCFTNPTC